MVNWLQRALGITGLIELVKQNRKEFNEKLNELSNSISIFFPKEQELDHEMIQQIDLQVQKDILSFHLIDNIDFKNWNLLGDLKQDKIFSDIAGGLTSLSAITYTSKGLYIASASPSMLIKYTNGSLSSITQKGTKFGEHAGFVKTNLKSFTPLLIFQFASMITAQYYFNGISIYLKEVNVAIETLISFHHNERESKLQYISNTLTCLIDRKFFTTEDYIIVENLKYELSIIKLEYLLSTRQEVNKFNLIETEAEFQSNNETAENINLLEKAKIAIKSASNKIWDSVDQLYHKIGLEGAYSKISQLTENSGKLVEKFSAEIKNSNFFFYANMSLKAEKLFQALQFVELKMNMSDQNLDANRIGKIGEIYNTLTYNKTKYHIFDDIEEQTNVFREFIYKFIEKAKSRSITNRTNISQQYDIIISKFENLESNLQSKNDILNESENIIKLFEAPISLLIDNRENNALLYVKNEN